MKKSSVIAFVLMGSVMIYAYFFIFKKEKNLKRIKIEAHSIAISQGLEKIKIKTEETEYLLELRDKKEWWIVEPILYPAKADFLERSLTVMNQVLADSVFPLNNDEYGFANSKSTMDLFYTSGEEKKIVLGSASGTGSQIYILNKELNSVYVVHNVWGQLLYYTMENILSTSLPIKQWNINSVEYRENGKRKWLAQLNSQQWTIKTLEKEVKINSSKLLWWLQSIKNMEVKPIKFKQKNMENPWVELIVKASAGEATLYFNKEANEIYIPSLKAIAQMDPFSLKSIELELEKALKSVK